MAVVETTAAQFIRSAMEFSNNLLVTEGHSDRDELIQKFAEKAFEGIGQGGFETLLKSQSMLLRRIVYKFFHSAASLEKYDANIKVELLLRLVKLACEDKTGNKEFSDIKTSIKQGQWPQFGKLIEQLSAAVCEKGNKSASFWIKRSVRKLINTPILKDVVASLTKIVSQALTAATQYVATQTSATQPSATQPSATQPSATQPSATQPVVTQPSVTPTDIQKKPTTSAPLVNAGDIRHVTEVIMKNKQTIIDKGFWKTEVFGEIRCPSYDENAGIKDLILQRNMSLALGASLDHDSFDNIKEAMEFRETLERVTDPIFKKLSTIKPSSTKLDPAGALERVEQLASSVSGGAAPVSVKEVVHKLIEICHDYQFVDKSLIQDFKEKISSVVKFLAKQQFPAEYIPSFLLLYKLRSEVQAELGPIVKNIVDEQINNIVKSENLDANLPAKSLDKVIQVLDALITTKQQMIEMVRGLKRLKVEVQAQLKGDQNQNIDKLIGHFMDKIKLQEGGAELHHQLVNEPVEQLAQKTDSAFWNWALYLSEKSGMIGLFTLGLFGGGGGFELTKTIVGMAFGIVSNYGISSLEQQAEIKAAKEGKTEGKTKRYLYYAAMKGVASYLSGRLASTVVEGAGTLKNMAIKQSTPPTQPIPGEVAAKVSLVEQQRMMANSLSGYGVKPAFMSPQESLNYYNDLKVSPATWLPGGSNSYIIESAQRNVLQFNANKNSYEFVTDVTVRNEVLRENNLQPFIDPMYSQPVGPKMEIPTLLDVLKVDTQNQDVHMAFMPLANGKFVLCSRANLNTPWAAHNDVVVEKMTDFKELQKVISENYTRLRFDDPKNVVIRLSNGDIFTKVTMENGQCKEVQPLATTSVTMGSAERLNQAFPNAPQGEVRVVDGKVFVRGGAAWEPNEKMDAGVAEGFYMRNLGLKAGTTGEIRPYLDPTTRQGGLSRFDGKEWVLLQQEVTPELSAMLGGSKVVHVGAPREGSIGVLPNSSGKGDFEVIYKNGVWRVTGNEIQGHSPFHLQKLAQSSSISHPKSPAPSNEPVVDKIGTDNTSFDMKTKINEHLRQADGNGCKYALLPTKDGGFMLFFEDSVGKNEWKPHDGVIIKDRYNLSELQRVMQEQKTEITGHKVYVGNGMFAAFNQDGKGGISAHYMTEGVSFNTPEAQLIEKHYAEPIGALQVVDKTVYKKSSDGSWIAQPAIDAVIVQQFEFDKIGFPKGAKEGDIQAFRSNTGDAIKTGFAKYTGEKWVPLTDASKDLVVDGDLLKTFGATEMVYPEKAVPGTIGFIRNTKMKHCNEIVEIIFDGEKSRLTGNTYRPTSPDLPFYRAFGGMLTGGKTAQEVLPIRRDAPVENISAFLNDKFKPIELTANQDKAGVTHTYEGVVASVASTKRSVDSAGNIRDDIVNEKWVRVDKDPKSDNKLWRPFDWSRDSKEGVLQQLGFDAKSAENIRQFNEAQNKPSLTQGSSKGIFTFFF